LRAVAAELSRWEHVERDEVDSLLVLGAWEALTVLGGTAKMWPDRAVVSRARDAARTRLLAEGRRSSRETLRDELAGQVASGPEQELGTLLAADILRSAVAKGSLGLSSAGLLWATRVEGASTAELARLGSRSPGPSPWSACGPNGPFERRWREVLTIAMLSAGSERYYVRSAFDAIDEYYVKGEERGYWVGKGSEALGLSGEVGAEDIRAVLEARSPSDGMSLVSAPAAPGRSRAGFDFTFSSPKGVSLIGLLGDPATSKEVLAAHQSAVAQALGYLERHATFVRRGHQGPDPFRAKALSAQPSCTSPLGLAIPSCTRIFCWPIWQRGPTAAGPLPTAARSTAIAAQPVSSTRPRCGRKLSPNKWCTRG